MKTIAVIPARSGSKRIPHKNIKELGGKPLLVWSIETSLAIPAIDGVYVSTDSRVYAEIAARAGAEAIHRPEELSTDIITDQEVLLHAIHGLEDVELIVYLRPTTPFRDVATVDIAIKIMEKQQYTGLRSVEEMSESAYKCFELNGNLLGPLTGHPWRITDQPNQLLPRTYRANGYVDIARTDMVKMGNLWGPQVFGVVTPRTVEIDTPDDLRYAEYEHSKKRWVLSV